jgi:F-type H+-transporting ATPase subunit gamma
MANLKEIRTSITSVSSTRQITSAMKMISAVKLRKAQDAIIQLRPYASKLHEIFTNINNSLSDDGENVYGQERELRKVLIVVVTSNRGQCGGFNSNVIKRSIQIAVEDYQKQLDAGNLSFMAVGKKGFDFLKAKKFPVYSSESELLNNLTFENVAPVVTSIMKSYIVGEFDKVVLVYNQFKNASVQILTTEQFLPVLKQKDEKAVVSNNLDYIFEPSKEEIVQELIPKSLKIQFYKALLDSFASEQGARMTAMHKATDNATDMLNALRLHYNKARQASITNEILEIVGGAEALNK